MPDPAMTVLDPPVEDAAPRTSVARRGRRPRRRTWIRRLLPVALTAAVTAAVVIGLEVAHALGDGRTAPLERLAAIPADVLAVSWVVVLAVPALLLALTGRLWLALSVTVAAAVVVGFSGYQKMLQREEPLYPSDAVYLSQLGPLADGVGTPATLALAAVVLGVPLLTWAVARRRPRRSRAMARGRYLVRGVSFALAATVLFSTVTFHEPGNVLRASYDAAGATWAPWNQRENYGENGFVAGLLYNLPVAAATRPSGYDEATMRAIAAEYRALAAATNTGRDPAALTGTNVVVVLSESFSDPLRMQGMSVGEDPIPFTRDLMAETTSGVMLSSGYGGGTANVEFEVLTGMAVRNFAPQMHTPFQMLVPRYEEFPSFATSLGGPERATLTIHPFRPGFYRRDVVYPALGFQRSEFREDMEHRRRPGGDIHVSDRSAFQEVVDELSDTDQPLLVNVVTMQNHTPMTGYDDPIEVEGPFGEDEAEALGQYLRGLRHSDEALEQLVADLDALGERTVVLFYGDHLPSVWPESVLQASGALARYETPYLVHATFDTTPMGVPTPVGPTFLVNQLLATAGAPVTPYNALLGELMRELPVLAPQVMLDHEGREVSEGELGARARELLQDYRLVQYDLSVGRRYVAAEMFEVPADGS